MLLRRLVYAIWPRDCFRITFLRLAQHFAVSVARRMDTSSASVRPCRGYFLWLTLQSCARLALRTNELYEEQWPVLAVVAMWCGMELASICISWRSNKSTHHSAAHGLALGCALAGLAFQKALFM